MHNDDSEEMNIAPQIPISKIYVGNIDVADELKYENFTDLYFDNDLISKSILNDNRFIIQGRKGTGKSYLANYLFKICDQDENMMCKICDQDDYNVEKILNIKSGIVKKDEVTLLWKWIIYSKFAELLLENYKIKKYIPFTSIKKLHFIHSKINKRLDLIFKPNSKVVDKGSKTIGTIANKSKILTGGREKSSQSSVQYDLVEYFQLIPDLEKAVLKALKNQKKTILIFDDLDELDGAADCSEEFKTSIVGLIKTVKEINLKISRDNHKAIIMIRSDIVRSLMTYATNINKQIEECNVTINWYDDKRNMEATEHPLILMILNKVRATVPEYSSLSYESLYNHLFPEKINNQTPFDYLLDYSFGRPRDIVAYLNKVKELEANSEVHYFSAKAFRKSKKKYSRWFLNELLNEISIHEQRKLVEQSIKIIRDQRIIDFKIEDVSNFYEENKKEYPNINDIRESLTILYQLGVVGNRNGKKTYWGHREDADVEPNFSQSFTLHYALRGTF